MGLKVLCVVEIDTDDPGEVNRRLDQFREAVLPAQEYGITLYRVAWRDALEFDLPLNRLGSNEYVAPIPTRD